MLIRVIEAFKLVDLPNIMTAGGPGIATESMTLHAFFAWRAPDLAQSAAISYLLLFVTVVLCVSFFNLVVLRHTGGAGMSASLGSAPPPAHGPRPPVRAGADRRDVGRRQGRSSTACCCCGRRSCCSRSTGWWSPRSSCRSTSTPGRSTCPGSTSSPNLHAWRDLLVTGLGDTLRPYLNSIIVGFLSTALCMLIGSMAAYALARIEYRPKFGTIVLFVAAMLAMAVAVGVWGVDWRISAAVAAAIFVLLARALGRRFQRRVGNGDILFWMISQRILPPVVTVIPIYMMFQSVRLLDTHIALILCYTVVNLPIVVWLMHDFFTGIPIDLEESAQLDGASRLTVFFEIVLPLARPGLAATTLLVLILSWNEYVLALFLSTSNAQTMPILVAAMNAGEKGILWWTMCVVIIIMIVPVILMALLLQRFIAKGVLLGAVKG